MPAKGDDPLTKPGEFPGPLTPVLATLSQDGKSICLVIVNGSWRRTVPCEVRLRNFEPAAAEGAILSHGDPDGKPLLERKSDAVADFPIALRGQQLACTLPPHSVVFVTVTGR